MPDSNEKAKRKQILHAQKAQQKQQTRDSLPCSAEMMSALFDHLDHRLASTECDSTFRFTHEFIRNNHLPTELIINWLENAGGHCDCEVISNAEPLLDDAFHQ